MLQCSWTIVHEPLPCHLTRHQYPLIRPPSTRSGQSIPLALAGANRLTVQEGDFFRDADLVHDNNTPLELTPDARG